MNMKKITLSQPITRGEEKISEITLRAITGAGDLRGIKLSAIQEFDVDTIMVLVKRLCMTPLSPDEMASIGPVDIVTIAGEIADFFRPSAAPSPTMH